MLMTVDSRNQKLYEAACAFERVMGSKCRSSFECYGQGHPETRFLLQQLITGEPTAALYLSGNVLLVSAGELANPGEIAEFIDRNGVKEADTNLRLATDLQLILGGEMESSYYMVYESGIPPEGDFSAVHPYQSLEDVFMVLQKSHDYYRTHLRFGAWAADTRVRLRHGAMELYQLDLDGELAGTGSIVSQDDECGVVAAVAVVPEHRGKGLGGTISKFLTRRILELGKIPRLLSGYDEVAEFYRGIGYREAGRWGELYL